MKIAHTKKKTATLPGVRNICGMWLVMTFSVLSASVSVTKICMAIVALFNLEHSEDKKDKLNFHFDGKETTGFSFLNCFFCFC